MSPFEVFRFRSTTASQFLSGGPTRGARPTRQCSFPRIARFRELPVAELASRGFLLLPNSARKV
jgi:hypothetical protein